jgi:hypothetical protein
LLLQATLADTFLADLDELSDNEAEIPVSIVFLFLILKEILFVCVCVIRLMSNVILFFNLRRIMVAMPQIWMKMLMVTLLT